MGQKAWQQKVGCGGVNVTTRWDIHELTQTILVIYIFTTITLKLKWLFISLRKVLHTNMHNFLLSSKPEHYFSC